MPPPEAAETSLAGRVSPSQKTRPLHQNTQDGDQMEDGEAQGPDEPMRLPPLVFLLPRPCPPAMGTF